MPTVDIQSYGAENYFFIILLGKHSGFLFCHVIKTIHFQNGSLCFRKRISFQELLLSMVLTGDASVFAVTECCFMLSMWLAGMAQACWAPNVGKRCS